MARKTHRPDDILWTVTATDIDAARSEKQDITLKTRMIDLYTTSYSEGMIALEPYETKVYQL